MQLSQRSYFCVETHTLPNLALCCWCLIANVVASKRSACLVLSIHTHIKTAEIIWIVILTKLAGKCEWSFFKAPTAKWLAALHVRRRYAASQSILNQTEITASNSCFSTHIKNRAILNLKHLKGRGGRCDGGALRSSVKRSKDEVRSIRVSVAGAPIIGDPGVSPPQNLVNCA